MKVVTVLKVLKAPLPPSSLSTHMCPEPHFLRLSAREGAQEGAGSQVTVLKGGGPRVGVPRKR